MQENRFDMPPGTDIAWCPGCGNHTILRIVKHALTDLNIDPTELVMVSGIGQAAKIPHYIKANVFNGLHGRSLPAASAIKAVNPHLTVIAEGGDGDMYGEGGNHFLHAVRRNPNITCIVHDNMVYGLTKGQASPTSQRGFVTKTQSDGVHNEPLNPISLAITLGAGFVARASTHDMQGAIELVQAAINHRGFALVDLFQPCVIYNKVNTFKWFKENTHYLDEGWTGKDRIEALQLAMSSEPRYLGIFYRNEEIPTFEEQLAAYQEDSTPVCQRDPALAELEALIKAKVG